MVPSRSSFLVPGRSKPGNSREASAAVWAWMWWEDVGSMSQQPNGPMVHHQTGARIKDSLKSFYQSNIILIIHTIYYKYIEGKKTQLQVQQPMFICMNPQDSMPSLTLERPESPSRSSFASPALLVLLGSGKFRQFFTPILKKNPCLVCINQIFQIFLHILAHCAAKDLHLFGIWGHHLGVDKRW